MGNLRSVTKALEAVGARIRLVETPDEIGSAAGLGAARGGGAGRLCRCARRVDWPIPSAPGFAKTARFSGVCLGLQALFERSEEGDARGLGVFAGRVVRFRLDALKVPHMGWNDVAFRDPARPLVRGPISTAEQFYFVHSYYVVPEDQDLIAGETEYTPDSFHLHGGPGAVLRHPVSPGEIPTGRTGPLSGIRATWSRHKQA